MSKTLLEMKDKLLELSRKKSEIGNFDRQMELLSMFAERVESLTEVYSSLNSLKSEISGLYQLAGLLESECIVQEEVVEQEIEEAAIGAGNPVSGHGRRLFVDLLFRFSEHTSVHRHRTGADRPDRLAAGQTGCVGDVYIQAYHRAPLSKSGGAAS